MATRRQPSTAPDTLAILTKAAFSAAKLLRITQSDLGQIIGVSSAAVSRAARNGQLPADPKVQELVILFLRAFRSLDAIVGGDREAAAAWMHGHNDGLGTVPLEAMKSISGLTDTLAYLDSRRGLV